MSPSGSLLYTTFFGGTSGGDGGNSIAVDSSGNAYVALTTNSADYPTVNAFQNTYNGGSFDAALTKLDASGAVVYSTYLGGSDGDEGAAVAVDSTGKAYLVGSTGSSNFPTKSAYQPVFAGSAGIADAYVTVLDTTTGGSPSLVYSTFLGGNNFDRANAVAVDDSSNVYVGGYTSSWDFPVKDGLGNFFDALFNEGWVAELSPATPGAGSLLWSSYFGGRTRLSAHSPPIPPEISGWGQHHFHQLPRNCECVSTRVRTGPGQYVPAMQ